MARTYPLPVALGLGRVARASNAAERLDALLKAAEVLSRYVAIAAVSSVASREDLDVRSGVNADALLGRPFAWGVFIQLARDAMSTRAEHPLRSSLVRGVGIKKSADRCGLLLLEDMLVVRNSSAAHSLTVADENKAAALLSRKDLDDVLLSAVRSFAPLLDLPLVVVQEQRKVKRREVARLLPLVGEGRPFPVEAEVKGTATDDEPCIVIGPKLLCLGPGLIWNRHGDSYEKDVLFLDQAGSKRAKYRSLHSDAHLEVPVDDEHDVQSWLAGEPQPADELTTSNGLGLRSLLLEEQVGLVERPVDTDDGPSSATDAPVAGPAAQTGPVDQPTKHQRRTVPELVKIAADSGLEGAFAQLLEVTRSIGLTHRPATHGVMVAPPNGQNRYLIWIGIKRTKRPYLKITMGRDRLAELFGVPDDVASELLGPDRRVHEGESVSDLVSGLQELAKMGKLRQQPPQRRIAPEPRDGADRSPPTPEEMRSRLLDALQQRDGSRPVQVGTNGQQTFRTAAGSVFHLRTRFRDRQASGKFRYWFGIRDDCWVAGQFFALVCDRDFVLIVPVDDWLPHIEHFSVAKAGTPAQARQPHIVWDSIANSGELVEGELRLDIAPWQDRLDLLR